MTTTMPEDGSGVRVRIKEAGCEDIQLRDYFAGQALAGAFTQVGDFENILFNTLAKDCYTVADAMMRARKPI